MYSQRPPADETADEPEPEPAVDYDEYEESEADEDDVLPLGVVRFLVGFVDDFVPHLLPAGNATVQTRTPSLSV